MFNYPNDFLHYMRQTSTDCAMRITIILHITFNNVNDQIYIINVNSPQKCRGKKISKKSPNKISAAETKQFIILNWPVLVSVNPSIIFPLSSLHTHTHTHTQPNMSLL